MRNRLDTHIVIVDDTASMCALAKHILTEHGYSQVLTVSSAANTLSLLKTVRPDLLICDMEMPEMNGIELIKQLRTLSDTANLPVIMMTCNTDRSTVMAAKAVGVVDFVAKPFTPALLCERVDAVANRYRHNDEKEQKV
jgi:DNA-binding response OmpR family regulator